MNKKNIGFLLVGLCIGAANTFGLKASIEISFNTAILLLLSSGAMVFILGETGKRPAREFIIGFSILTTVSVAIAAMNFCRFFSTGNPARVGYTILYVAITMAFALTAIIKPMLSVIKASKRIIEGNTIST